jgi:hypothetical protein
MTEQDNSSNSSSGIRARLRSVVQLPRPTVAAMVSLAAGMVMVGTAAAQSGSGKGICAIGAAEAVLELGFLIMVGSIAALGIFKFGGGIAKWLMGGSKGSAALRLSLLAAVGGIFLALGFEDILTWFAGKAAGGGGGLGSIGVKCMLPG